MRNNQEIKNIYVGCVGINIVKHLYEKYGGDFQAPDKLTGRKY